MEPRELLQALLDRDGENSHSLAAKLRGKPSQPQIHKFLKGVAKEPRRSTLQPLADHFGVPLDAFYDAGLAKRVMGELHLGKGGGVSASEPSPAAWPTQMVELTPEQLQLLQDLDDIAPSRASKFRDAIHEAAEEAREVRAHHASKEKTPDKSAAARRGGSTKSTTSMTYGDGNRRQRSLPLTTVPDPFTAEPSEREAALYHRIERAPKEPHGDAQTKKGQVK